MCSFLLQVADFNLSRVMEASSVASSLAATNPRYCAAVHKAAWLVL